MDFQRTPGYTPVFSNIFDDDFQPLALIWSNQTVGSCSLHTHFAATKQPIADDDDKVGEGILTQISNNGNCILMLFIYVIIEVSQDFG